MTRNKQGDATAIAPVPQLSVSATLATLHPEEARSDHSGHFGGHALKKLLHRFHLGLPLPHASPAVRTALTVTPWEMAASARVTADTSPQLPMSLQHPVGRLSSFISSVGLLFPSPPFPHSLSAITLLQKILSRHHEMSSLQLSRALMVSGNSARLGAGI